MFGSFLLFSIWETIKDKVIASYFLIIGAIPSTISVSVVLFGFWGTIDVTGMHLRIVETKKCMNHLPAPIYVNDIYASLPWINSSEHSFVLAATYYYKDAFGDIFEGGGVDGLIKNGFFKTIVLPSDGQRIVLDSTIFKEHYEKKGIKDCENFTIYLNKVG